MRQNLIVDADDTLWENNIFFERAFEEFVQFLAHSTLSPVQVRADPRLRFAELCPQPAAML
jgi:putative hydrolase of the HAD superfamily